MPLFELDGQKPSVHPTAFVAPTAVLIGDVVVEAEASVWFGAVLRGDQARITIGAGSNVQDNAVIHCAEGLPTVVGAGVTIGHGAKIEGCVVGDGSTVGTGAIMLQRSRLGSGSVLAAGAVLMEGHEVPSGTLAAGVPALPKKPLSGSSARWAREPALRYQANRSRYLKGLRPPD
ncbi:MAG TPA: gamma carbonic anhydrase family protein [Candidatus Acidoferrales bacterium]|nr:gamma carbonic anhydrase family protein [Candidatus Acidoferrales bacterium]